MEKSSAPTRLPHYKLVLDKAGITPEVAQWEWEGSGTEEDPYVVGWITGDPRNPMDFTATKKWGLTMMVAFATLAVAFVSSAYSGGDKVGSGIRSSFSCDPIAYTDRVLPFLLRKS